MEKSVFGVKQTGVSILLPPFACPGAPVSSGVKGEWKHTSFTSWCSQLPIPHGLGQLGLGPLVCGPSYSSILPLWLANRSPSFDRRQQCTQIKSNIPNSYSQLWVGLWLATKTQDEFSWVFLGKYCFTFSLLPFLHVLPPFSFSSDEYSFY